MTKKTFITFIMLMMSAMSFASGDSIFVGNKLDLEVGYYDEEQPFKPRPRTPENVPIIYFDGATLYFATHCDGCTLQITDEMGNICYEVVIPMGTQQISLPDYLVGEYELRIIQGNTFYFGEINITND